MNQKFAKRVMLAASLTAGVVGFNSMFNEAQATGAGKVITTFKCYDKHGNHTGQGNSCDAGTSTCNANPC